MDTHRHADARTHTQHVEFISLLPFLLRNKVGQLFCVFPVHVANLMEDTQR
jgi:hypothetical protein